MALGLDAPPEPIANETFFQAASTRARRAPHREGVGIPEDVYYGDARRPPAETPIIVRAAESSLAFGGLLFLLGWLGILAQRSAIRQIVVGAPVFEEMAKFGLALAFVSLLGARHLLARLPFAWLSGLGFGILEHFLSYSSEAWYELAVRAAFHAGTCGLSMAAYSVLEPMADVRARWGTTLASSLLHWANNFAAVVLALVSIATPSAELIGQIWSTVVVLLAFAVTIVVITSRARLERALRDLLARLLPPLTSTEAAGDPRSTSPPTPPPPPPPPEAELVPPWGPD